MRRRRDYALQSEPSDRRGSFDTTVFTIYVPEYCPVIGTVTPRRRCPAFPSSLLSYPPPQCLGVLSVPGPPRFTGQLSRERLLPRGLLALVWLVDSFSGSDVLFDMSFKSFKELGVSAERLGSFCKRWMARVQRSGCFFLPPSFATYLSLAPPLSFPLSLLLSFKRWY